MLIFAADCTLTAAVDLARQSQLHHFSHSSSSNANDNPEMKLVGLGLVGFFLGQQ